MIEQKIQGELRQTIVTANCDSHMSNLLSNQASGTSGRKNNMNPVCDYYPSNIHNILVFMIRPGTHIKVYDDVQNEHGRKKVQTLDFSVHTLCNSAHSETMCSTSNNYDLDVAIHKITCEGGIDEDLFFSHSEN